MFSRRSLLGALAGLGAALVGKRAMATVRWPKRGQFYAGARVLREYDIPLEGWAIDHDGTLKPVDEILSIGRILLNDENARRCISWIDDKSQTVQARYFDGDFEAQLPSSARLLTYNRIKRFGKMSRLHADGTLTPLPFCPKSMCLAFVWHCYGGVKFNVH